METDSTYICEMIADGKIEEARAEAKKIIEDKVTDIKIYNLFIELSLMNECTLEDINVCDKKRNILNSLLKIYTISNDYGDSLEFIYKECFSSFHAIWARDVYNYITRYVQSESEMEYVIASRYTNYQNLCLETVCENLSTDEAIDFLSRVEIKSAEHYQKLRIGILSQNKELIEVNCKVKQIRDLLNLMNVKTFEPFSKYIEGDVTQTNKIRATKKMWDTVEGNNNCEKAIDYFIHLFIQQEEYAIVAPVEKFIDYFENQDGVDRSNIRIPIVEYIYTTYFDQMKNEDLSISCEDFFDLNGFERPSRMPSDTSKYSKEELIFFLKNICIPSIMGPVLLSIRTTKELDQERINICQYLRSIDPDNEEQYDQEIKETTHRIFINDSVSALESNKIHVNTEGIKNRLNKDLKSVFNKYMYSRNTKLDEILSKIKTIEGGEKLSLLSFDTSKMLVEIVTTIRNEFVQGAEYGLDAYLSLNIRHGTLTGQLRAPLAKKDLLAEYDITTGGYKVCERWLYCIRDDKEKKRVFDAIVEFTKETDAIIDYLKKELIQISTEEKPSNGLFKYEINESQIGFFQTFLTEKCEFEEFEDFLFETFWAYTDDNLKEMRTVIRNEIKKKYISAFSKLQKVYKDISVSFPEAEREIQLAQNEMDAELEKICNWFKRGQEGQYPDFELESAFYVGLETIRNIHPESVFEIRSFEKDVHNKLDGWRWKSYCNVFNTLFDNVSQYAMEKSGIKYVDCRLEVNDNSVVIQLENDFDFATGKDKSEQKVAAAMELIEDASYLSRAKQEGGSGIPKIYKIFAIDLNMKVNINCNFDSEKEKFIIRVEGLKK